MYTVYAYNICILCSVTLACQWPKVYAALIIKSILNEHACATISTAINYFKMYLYRKSWDSN